MLLPHVLLNEPRQRQANGCRPAVLFGRCEHEPKSANIPRAMPGRQPSDDLNELQSDQALFSEQGLTKGSPVLAKKLISDFEPPAGRSWNWYPDPLEEYARCGASAERPSWQFSLTEMLTIITGGSIGMALSSLIPQGHLGELVGVALVVAIPTLYISLCRVSIGRLMWWILLASLLMSILGVCVIMLLD